MYVSVVSKIEPHLKFVMKFWYSLLYTILLAPGLRYPISYASRLDRSKNHDKTDNWIGLLQDQLGVVCRPLWSRLLGVCKKIRMASSGCLQILPTVPQQLYGTSFACGPFKEQDKQSDVKAEHGEVSWPYQSLSLLAAKAGHKQELLD